MLRRLAFCVAVVTAIGLVPAVPAYAADFTVLVFSKTAGFRHDSIPTGITAIQQLGTANNFTVETTEDSAQFTAANLARFQAVIWLSTTGDVLTAAQQTAFENYVRAGGGYVGIHAAADTEYDWAWYGNLVGAYFLSHPAIQNATVRIESPNHPSTVGIPATWPRNDEWYNYRTNPRSQVHVLATLDESTYSGGSMGGDHPISWCRAYDGGRSWYTGLGHTQASFSEANFRTHLLGGIRYAAQGSGSCPVGPSNPSAGYNMVTLAKGVAETGEPMGLTVLPNRGVLHTSRDGTVRYTDAAGNTSVAGNIPVYTHDEEGLQSIKADPNFATNRWVYLFYAPPLSTPAGDAPATGTAAQFAPFNGVNRISRFTVNANHTLNMASAVTIIDIPTSRGMCCHVGGDMDFDAAGNLYISTGDDTNPFDSSGYTPIDERADRNPAFDAQRTSGNTNDLRGKVLRITPLAAGGYSIPAGNMFTQTATTRGEIYAMGFRNPFRMSVDKATGVVYLGDYGPDSGTASGTRGPAGTVAFERIAQPGNYGWPYCSNFNVPYIDFTFPSGPSGSAFNCAGGPVNNSPRNTGLTQLQASRAAWLPYGYGQDRADLCCGSLSPMGGPVYNYNASLVSDVKFPQTMSGKVFIGEFGRRWIKTVTVLNNGGLGVVEPFPAFNGTQVMDMEFGPDGALYVLDYGTGWFGGDANSAVYRIEYNSGGGRAPIPVINATPRSGNAPLTVQFSSAGSADPDGNPITFAWDFTTNGSTDSTAANPSFTYTTSGSFTATLTVSDNTGRSATASVVIGVNVATASLTAPANGRVFNFGDAIPFTASATDPNGAVDCARMRVNYILGHDSHGHPITSVTGCSGTIQTTVDGEHDANANIFGVLVAEYTPVGQTTPVTSSQVVLQPRSRQAEHFTAQQGVTVVAKPTANGGNAIGNVENGDWISFNPYNLTGVTSITARVASAGVGGTISLRTGSATGPVIGTLAVSPTGGWETWVNVTGTVTPPTTTQNLFFVFTGGAGALLDIDSFVFNSGTQPPNPDLALNKPATASSVENAAFPASAAVDGSATTRWSSLASDPQWIQVDLGQTYTINRVRLLWEAAYGSAYQIQVSTNGTTWTTARSITGGNGGEDDNTGLNNQARYVRINGTTRGTVWGYSLFSFEVYGGTGQPPVTDLALNKPATASSVESAAYPASAAVDGSGTTRWSSAFSDPQWIQVDLGQTYTISRVRLVWEAAYGSAYQIQVSTNGTTWTNARSITGGNGGEDDNTGLNNQARYVRINGTTRATAWGYSLFTFEVYGS